VDEAKAARDDGRSRSDSSASSDGESFGRPKRDRESSDEILTAEAEQLVFSQGSNADREARRTGRWTDDEVKYSDELVNAFDNGQLPLAHGTKLATFLGDALQCKASRLTKKMKNAKLSTRSFELSPAILQTNSSASNREPLSILQARFVASMNCEYTQLELGFNLGLHWRTSISDLCVQVGYPFLDGSSFISTLEEYERLGESMRNVRRRRWVDICGTSPNDTQSASLMNSRGLDCNLLNDGSAIATTEPAIVSTNNLMKHDVSEHEELLDEAFANCFEEDTPPKSYENPKSSLSSHNPFMDVIADYLESQNLPFQHADTWVLSHAVGAEPKLINAGAVTRRDQDGERWSAFENFGVYSSKFTFAPGKGLVGRVFASRQTMWEYGINKLDPQFFLRAGGAEEYGVRTAVGIPLSSVTGMMVVVLYSCNHIPEDLLMASQFEQELSQYSPAPKWKLVVDLKNAPLPREPKTTVSGSMSESRSHSPDSFLGLDLDATGEERPHACRVSPPSTPRDGHSTDHDESEIISLIGDQLASDSEGAFEDPETFHYLLKMRLMLLRPANRRSDEENEKVELLRISYKDHSSSAKFGRADLLRLLAQEWKCLLQFSESLDHHIQQSPFAPADSYVRHDIQTNLAPSSTFNHSKMWELEELQPRPLKPTSNDTLLVYDHSLSVPQSMSISQFSYPSNSPGMARSRSSSAAMSVCSLPAMLLDTTQSSRPKTASFSGWL
jgi:bHLH-MYC and R2R3-MYB transcription factors N-terminal